MVDKKFKSLNENQLGVSGGFEIPKAVKYIALLGAGAAAGSLLTIEGQKRESGTILNDIASGMEYVHERIGHAGNHIVKDVFGVK